MAKKKKNRIEIGKALDTGIKRRGSLNQDAIGILPPSHLTRRPPLFVVADGMGGQQEGALAAKFVIDSIISSFRKTHYKKNLLNAINSGINSAHGKMLRYVKRNKEVLSMGAAVVAAVVKNREVYLANVGDARIYLIDKVNIQQISFEHSFVAEQVRQGLIKPSEAINHPRLNILTMSITSKRNSIEIFTDTVPFEKDSILLLCSDGLWGTVSETQIQDVVLELPPQEAADKLVEMANMNQGPDNISVIIVRL